MNTPRPSPPRLPRNIHAWVRQIHLWVGAWGALAAILYGATGLVLNHRMGENPWPQGKTTPAGETVLQVPAEARATPEQLSLWLRETRRLDATMIRKGGPGGGRGASAGGPPRWTLSGGSAGNSWALEYAPGNESATLRRSRFDVLAALNRLHKGIGGPWWIALADSFAIAMLLLGVTGIWIWSRGRGPRQIAFSVLGVATVVFAAMVGMQVFG